MEKLQTGKAWVVLTFQDGTKQCIFTTLNKNILQEYGVTPRPGVFFDLEHMQFVAFRRDAVSADLFSERPVFGEEVLAFASRFI